MASGGRALLTPRAKVYGIARRRLLTSPARPRIVIRILMAVLLVAAPAAAAVPLGCTGSATLGTFQLSIGPFSRGSPLPLKSVAAITAGSRLIWNPVHLTPPASSNAEVAVVLVPDSGGDLIILEPRSAVTRTEWQLLERPQAIALIFGPQGLSEGKIKSLVAHNRNLVKQLADYAEQSSEVESLVQEIADAEQSGGGTDAILKGFSSQYGCAGVSAPQTTPAHRSVFSTLPLPHERRELHGQTHIDGLQSCRDRIGSSARK